MAYGGGKNYLFPANWGGFFLLPFLARPQDERAMGGD